MTKVLSGAATASGRVSWNKGKIIGAKPPLRPKHVGFGLRKRTSSAGSVMSNRANSAPTAMASDTRSAPTSCAIMEIAMAQEADRRRKEDRSVIEGRQERRLAAHAGLDRGRMVIGSRKRARIAKRAPLRSPPICRLPASARRGSAARVAPHSP